MTFTAIDDSEDPIPVFARWFGSWRVSVQRRPHTTIQLGELYDHAAPGWCRMLDRLGVSEAYESILATVLENKLAARLDPPARVLDCGVGTGALSMALARVVPVPFAIDGIDISQRMLELAANRFGQAGLHADLQQGDIRNLPYDDNQFDLVMAAHVLEHIADPLHALKEMMRVLRPGGTLIACVTRRSLLGLFIQLKWRTHRISRDQAVRWLVDAGLENTQGLSFAKRSLCQSLSVACIGTKPSFPSIKQTAAVSAGERSFL